MVHLPPSAQMVYSASPGSYPSGELYNQVVTALSSTILGKLSAHSFILTFLQITLVLF